ncbi:hypothetical protein E2I00_001663, partial [Balaenoptera physalus]
AQGGLDPEASQLSPRLLPMRPSLWVKGPQLSQCHPLPLAAGRPSWACRKLGSWGQAGCSMGRMWPSLSLPLDPQEVAQEMCKAVPFTQVLSRLGFMAGHLLNHLCFGHCSSSYIPAHPLQQLCVRSHALGTCGSLVLGGQPSLPSPGEGCPLCGLRGVSADQRHELSITNGHADARTLERRGKTG